MSEVNGEVWDRLNTGRRIGLGVTIALALAASAIWAAFAAGSARAFVIVGSPVSTFTTVTTGFFNGPFTEVNTSLSEPGAYVTSPVNGTINDWSVLVNAVGPMAVRVIRPAGGGAYTGVSTRKFTPAGTGDVGVFPGSLPIRAGDLVGLDLITSAARVGSEAIPGSGVSEWGGSGGLLADGSTLPPDNVFPSEEVAFSAVVNPSSDFSVDGVRRHKKKGTATIHVTVPNPGMLFAHGRGVGPLSLAQVGESVATGPVHLLIKARGAKRRKLNATGKVTLGVTLAFAPDFEGNRLARTQDVAVKLKKNL